MWYGVSMCLPFENSQMQANPKSSIIKMPLLDSSQSLVVIVGPTAVGKTEISIQLAERLSGEIISADSRLFYRGMDIGTAKPTPQDQIRIPHHLVDIADPDEIWSLAMFQREVHISIADVHTRGYLPFLVGGTGQYVRAVTEEWEIPKATPDHRLREALESWVEQIGADGLYNRLTQLDPEAASRIDPRNLRRIIRAIEVILLTGEKFSAQKKRGSSRYRLLQLGLTCPRPELYARIDARIDAMLAAGFVAEVQSLLEAGYSPELPALSAIGYRQMIEYLQSKVDLDEAIRQMKRITRQFVRRQANWFKLDDPNIQWFEVEPQTVDRMESAVRAFLLS
jgi:tRNA dimethylallyltransferase